MNDFSIKNRLIILIIIPLTCVVFFGLLLTNNKYNNFKKLDYSENIIELSLKINSIINSIELEKMLLIEYLDKKKLSNKIRISREINISDNKILLLNKSFKKIILNKKLEEKVVKINKSFLLLKEFRKNFEYKAFSKLEIITFYTNVNTNLSKFVLLLSQNIKNEDLKNEFISFQKLLKIKELFVNKTLLFSYLNKEEKSNFQIKRIIL